MLTVIFRSGKIDTTISDWKNGPVSGARLTSGVAPARRGAKARPSDENRSMKTALNKS
jgi:hypothetical protein